MPRGHRSAPSRRDREEPLMEPRFEIGATVLAGDGEVGTLENVVADPATGEPSVLVVRPRDGGPPLDIPLAVVDETASSPGAIRLAVDREALGVTTTTATTSQGFTGVLDEPGDRLVLPVHEEVLVPTTHEVQVGTVRIEKRVETVPVETTVDAMLDEIQIQRVAVDRPVASAPAPRHEGDTLVIPVVEEVVVTEKRLVLREEIRVTRRRVAQPVTIQDTVRREVVEIHDPEGTGYHVGAGAPPVGGPSPAAATTPAPPAPTDEPFEPTDERPTT
jgi:uncharacterized protein (TIGR02271 family)